MKRYYQYDRFKNKIMKWILMCIAVIPAVLTGFKPDDARSLLTLSSRQEDDTLIWQAANKFTALFNSGDTAAMNQFLPEGFMLQWLHDNFMGKKAVLNAMVNPSVHATLRHLLNRDAQTTIGYSDDRSTASLDATFLFLDQALSESIKKQHGYGLCIMQFKKINSRWWLQTVHLDLHCSLCNL